MKCPKCNSEIANDSKFCEFCGTKLTRPKKKKWLIGIICSLLIVGAVVGILSLVNYYRWKDIYNNEVSHWPDCRGGDGTYYILQKEFGQDLVRVYGEFPIRIKRLVSVRGEIFSCEGEHSRCGAFALLEDDGKIQFVMDYSLGSLFPDKSFSILGEYENWYSDEDHIYGRNDDYKCGTSYHNVKNLFPYDKQPVRDGVNGKWFFINSAGEKLSDMEFDDAYPFCCDIARVNTNGEWFYIRLHDNEINKLKIGSNNYKIIEGHDFEYDESNRVVANMKLYDKQTGRYLMAVVNEEGGIVEYYY